MAESTLSLSYPDFKASVGFYLGFRRDETEWLAEQVAAADRMVQAGYRQLESPPILPGEVRAHAWSHLQPTATITVLPEKSGTLGVVPTRTGGQYIFQSALDVFVSSMVGSLIKMTSTGALYDILELISASRVTVRGRGTAGFDNTFASTLVSANVFFVGGLTTVITATDPTPPDTSTQFLTDLNATVENIFRDDMVGDSIVFGSDSYTIIKVISETVVEVQGDASSKSGSFNVDRAIDVSDLIDDTFITNQSNLHDSMRGSYKEDLTRELQDSVIFDTSGNSYLIDIFSSAAGLTKRVHLLPDGVALATDNPGETTAVIRRVLSASSTVGEARTLIRFTDQVFDDSVIGQSIRFDNTGDSYEITSVTIETGETLGNVVEVKGDASTETGDVKVVQTIGTVTGALSYTSPLTTVTITAANFLETMEGMILTFHTSGNSYTIGGFTDTTTVTLIGNAGGEKPADKVFVTGATDLDSGDAFIITNTGDDYELPDDFGGAEGRFTFGADEGFVPIPQIDQGQLRALRMRTRNGRPQFVALRMKSVSTTPDAGQRYELMVWPTPDAAYTLHYEYRAIPQKLTDAKPFPLGGMRHSETLKASCLAVAELEMNDESDLHRSRFLQLLAADVSADRESIVPETMGLNTDPSIAFGGGADSVTRSQLRSNTPVTNNGVLPT